MMISDSTLSFFVYYCDTGITVTWIFSAGLT